MFTKTHTDFALENNIKNNRKSLEESFARNYSIQYETLQRIIQSVNHCDFNGFKDNRLVWNVAGYLNIVSFDLKVIGEHLALATLDWKRAYFARQSALLIYESLNDLFELLSKDFRQLINSFKKAEEFKAELKEITKALNEYKDKHIQSLKTIRNTSIAHREKDSIEQIKSITSINWSNAIEFTTQFDNILNRLGTYSQRVINTCLQESGELKK